MKLQIENLGKVSPTVEGYWDKRNSYNRLCVVTYKFDPIHFRTYISRKPVPAGIDITDDRYWLPTACFIDGKLEAKPIPRIMLDEILLGKRHCVSKAWYEGREFKDCPVHEEHPCLTPGVPDPIPCYEHHHHPHCCDEPGLIDLGDLWRIMSDPIKELEDKKDDTTDDTTTDTDTGSDSDSNTDDEKQELTDEQIKYLLDFYRHHHDIHSHHHHHHDCECDFPIRKEIVEQIISKE